MNTFRRYHQAVDYLEGLSNLPQEKNYMRDRANPTLYLKRMRYFLALLGNPDRKFKFIHITGTAGKGTVTTMVHEILHASGKKVGSFTSPFVTTSIEKIRVGEKYISPDELADIVEYLKPYVDAAYAQGQYGRPSYFELFLAIAFVYFKRQKCEWVVLEAGLGGRYDATNVIEKPVITAITNIDYDHTEVLGKTLKQIARDKAGIIKKGAEFLTAEQRPALRAVFQKMCTEKKVPVFLVPRQKSYQEYNHRLAAAIAERVGILEKYIEKGIGHTRLQCRFEIMQKNPLVVLDGAHNRAKIASTIENLKQLDFQKLFLIVGIADSKDKVSMLKQIAPYADHLLFTRFQIKDRKCAHPKELLALSKRYAKKGAKVNIFLDPQQALACALRQAGAKDLILTVGSFFLAGELRKNWIPEEIILRKRALR
ncbi:MAG: hypothetical protein HY617_02245 [Candidatus Sungbacteria bacterium]|nr:hypothetical protein [Candidatus Sungbacteria bacterium]